MNSYRLAKQAKHIETFINKSKLTNKCDGLFICGHGLSNYRIIRAINGELKIFTIGYLKNVWGKMLRRMRRITLMW